MYLSGFSKIVYPVIAFLTFACTTDRALKQVDVGKIADNVQIVDGRIDDKMVLYFADEIKNENFFNVENPKIVEEIDNNIYGVRPMESNVAARIYNRHGNKPDSVFLNNNLEDWTPSRIKNTICHEDFGDFWNNVLSFSEKARFSEIVSELYMKAEIIRDVERSNLMPVELFGDTLYSEKIMGNFMKDLERETMTKEDLETYRKYTKDVLIEDIGKSDVYRIKSKDDMVLFVEAFHHYGELIYKQKSLDGVPPELRPFFEPLLDKKYMEKNDAISRISR